MRLFISPCLLILAALVALAWNFRGPVLRAMYRVRAERLRRSIERDLKGTLICLVGLVDDDSAPVWCRKIRAADPDKVLHLLIHSYGGASQARSIVSRCIAAYQNLVVAHVPIQAWSAGTALALAADSVMMGPDAAMGPTDPGRRVNYDTTWCVYEVAGHDTQTPDQVVGSRASLSEAEEALRRDRSTRRAFWASKKPWMQGTVQAWSNPIVRDDGAVINTDPADPDAHLVAQLVRGGWGNHFRPIFVDDAKRLGIAACSEAPSTQRRMAELARLTNLSLRECDR